MKRLAILVLLLCTACSMTEFFRGNNLNEASNFNGTVDKINAIDKENNISFSDYENGLEYLRTHMRYPDPLNTDEIDPIIKEYAEITTTGEEAAGLYVSFRKNILLSEKHYMLAYKSYKGDIKKYGVRCSFNESILESFSNQNKSIALGRDALQDIKALKEKYPNEFSQLNISDEWMEMMDDFYTDSEGDLGYKNQQYEYFCIVRPQKIQNNTLNST
jgi:hypothetical protein